MPGLFFAFYLISRFSPVSPMYDPSGSPPSGCPISHLFLAARRASSPPVCGCSRLHLCLLEVQRYQKSAIRCITWCVVQCCGIKFDCCSGRNPESFHQRGIICIFHRDILLSAEYQYGISCGNIDLRASVILNSIELMIVAYAPAICIGSSPYVFCCNSVAHFSFSSAEMDGS